MSRERRVDPCRMLANVLWLVGSVCVATGDVEASGPEVLTPEALHHAATVVDLHADTLHRLTRPESTIRRMSATFRASATRELSPRITSRNAVACRRMAADGSGSRGDAHSTKNWTSTPPARRRCGLD